MLALSTYGQLNGFDIKSKLVLGASEASETGKTRGRGDKEESLLLNSCRDVALQRLYDFCLLFPPL
jgi:hypothetical protein